MSMITQFNMGGQTHNRATDSTIPYYKRTKWCIYGKIGTKTCETFYRYTRAN